MSFRRAPIERIGQMHVTPRHFRRVCDCLRYPGFIAAPLVVIGLLSVAPAGAKPPIPQTYPRFCSRARFLGHSARVSRPS